MHKLFPVWYLVADPAASSEKIKRRWSAIEALLSPLTRIQLPELARFATRTAAQPPTGVVAAIKQHAETMATRDVDQEIRILVCALLRVAIERMDSEGNISLAVAAALALLASSFGMKDQPPWLSEHLTAAATTVGVVARRAR